jgi:hypothetical protein
MVEVLRRLFGSSTPDPAVRRLVDEIEAFRTLPAGWNSYRAPKISDTAIDTALAVVEILVRRRVQLPSAAPMPFGGVSLTWDRPGDLEVQLLIEDESLDYNVARRGHPKVLEQGSIKMEQLERHLIDRYVVNQP